MWKRRQSEKQEREEKSQRGELGEETQQVLIKQFSSGVDVKGKS